jgi:hypothetical protein
LFHIQTGDRPGVHAPDGGTTMSPHRLRRSAGAVSPTLAALIAALEEVDSRDRPGEARALHALAELAVKQVPARGVFAPSEPDVSTTIEQIAKDHLGMEMPRRVFLAATARVEEFADREAIEAAANHMMTLSDLAYFYAGLAFGITFVQYGEARRSGR